MKKTTIILGIAIVVAAGLLFILRFMTLEDTWICDHGVWVKHGNPSAAKPTSQCGQSLINSTVTNTTESNANSAGNINANGNINAAVANSNSTDNLNTNAQDTNNQLE